MPWAPALRPKGPCLPALGARPLTAPSSFAPPPPNACRVVVLGSGWGAVSFIKNLDPAAFGGKWGLHRHATLKRLL